MTREEFSTAADLSECSYRYAMEKLAGHGDSAEALVVHPYAKHLARHIAYFSGWRIPVVIDAALDEDEWLVRGTTVEIHSAGA